MAGKPEFKDPPKGIDMKKIKKVVIAALFLFVLALPTSVKATYYNGTDSTTTESWVAAAIGGYQPSMYTLTAVRQVALSDLQINSTNVTDDLRAVIVYGTVTWSGIWANYSISETEPLVNNITFTYEGYGMNTFCDNVKAIEIWAWNSTHWVQLATSNTTYGTDTVLAYEMTSGFSDYVQGSQIYALYTAQTNCTANRPYAPTVDYFDVEVTEAAAAAPAVQTINDTYPQLGEAIFLNFTVANTSVISTYFLQTNESGSWQDIDGLYDSPRTAEAVYGNMTNFTWVNSSLCNRVLGLRVHFNDSTNTWYYSDTNVSYLLPYINSSTAFRANLSASSCDNSSHIDYRFTWEQSGYMEAWLNHVMVGSNYTCPYTMTGVSNFSATNETNYCYIKGRLSGITRYEEYYISRSAAYEFVEPPNIPKAILVNTIIFIVVVVTVTVTRKSGGW